MSCSSRSNMPTTVTEVMARAQMLLDFPSMADKMDERRTSIRSLIKFGDVDRSQLAEPSRRPPTIPAVQTDGHVAGGVPTVQSPSRLPQWTQRTTEPDDVSMASSDPQTQQDQRQVLLDRRVEDARTTIQ